MIIKNNLLVCTKWALLLLFLIVLGLMSQGKESGNLVIVDGNFGLSGRIPVAQNLLPVVSLPSVKQKIDLTQLDMSFRFMTLDPTFSYGNLFQTSDGSDAVRMELQPLGRLVVVFGDGHIFTLSETIEVAKNYDIRVEFQKDKYLKIYLDGDEVLAESGHTLLAQQLGLSHVLLGTGMSAQRNLNGSVTNFKLSADYESFTVATKLARYLLVLLCGIIFIVSQSFPRVGRAATQGDKLDREQLTLGFLLYGLVLFFLLCSSLIAYYFGGRHIGLVKWIPYLILPLSMLLGIHILIRKITLSNRFSVVMMVVFLIYACGMIVSNAAQLHSYTPIVTGLILFSVAGYLIHSQYLQVSLKRAGILQISICVCLLLILALAWSSSIDIFYLETYLQQIDENFGLAVVLSFLILYSLFNVVFGVWDVRNNYSFGKAALSGRLVDVAVCVAFLWISFRHDSLFIPGAEYHWEYFSGVIRTLRTGGLLWWDVPSQYGFLNIFLASLVPVKSAWQAFYVFQGTLLFITSTGLYFTLTRYARGLQGHRLFIFGIVFLSLFYADPHLIGPYPFPSSSVVRFFCCYISLMAVLLVPSFSLRQAVVCAACWLLSLLWSAESAVYGTAIYLFILIALTQARGIEDRFFLLRRYIVAAGLGLLILVIILLSIYVPMTGAVPDIGMYFSYALGYAAGFGYVPFKINGPWNLLLLIFCGICIICFAEISRARKDIGVLAPMAALAGCVWGVASYYLGRPVPQNITAMLPIISFILYASILLASKAGIVSASLPIKSIAIPLFFLIFIPLTSTKWREVQLNVRSFSPDISLSLRPATPELEGMLEHIDSALDAAFVYYGNDAAPPVFYGRYANFNENAWLPVPLQLLEVPIKEERRTSVVERYLCRKQIQKGILVSSNEPDIVARLDVFLMQIRRYYKVEQVERSAAYTVRLFTVFDSNNCRNLSQKP